MRIRKIGIQVALLIGVIFILFPYTGQAVLAFTSENASGAEDNIKVDFKQIKEVAKPTWKIINSGDSRDGKISQSLAATVVSIVNTDIVNNGWLSASDMLTWLYPEDTIEQMKSENVSAEQAVSWLNTIGYTASIVNRALTTDEIKKSLDKSSPIVTIFESQNVANWLERETTGVLYAHSDLETGTKTDGLHASFIKTAYHGELEVKDGTEGNPFKFDNQDDNPDTTIASSDFRWIKSITDIKKDPSWDSRSKVVSNRANGVFNVDLTKAGNDITNAIFTDQDVQELGQSQPITEKGNETKLSAVSLINFYFDKANKKTVKDLEAFAKIAVDKDVSGEQIVSWYKSLGFSCDTVSGKLTKELTKTISSSGKLYLTTYKAVDIKNKYQQASNIGIGFSDNNFGYTPGLNSIIKSEFTGPEYSINWSSPNAYQTYIAKSKNFNYDLFFTMDSSIPREIGKYLPSLTIYNIRQKSEPENASPQFKPTTPNVTAPVKTATYNTNNNFGIRETQNQEPWCSSYVEAAAVNAFRKATDVPVTSAQILMKLNRPGLSDDELKKVSGTTIEDNAKKIKDNYNIGVTIVDRALSFSEVKTEIDSGKIIQMDAYNINATTPEEGYGHALAIVGYVTPNDGDTSKSPYYEIWNPWWNSTFCILANNKTFRLAGIDYKWTRSWYNWRQDGVGSLDKKVENQPVTSMGNPKAVANKPIIAKNPLLIGSTFYTSIYLNSSTDVMTQHVSQFGRETAAWSILGNDTFGYSMSTESAHAFQRARHGKRTVNNPSNSDVAVNFRNDVDQINYSYLGFAGAGLGSPAIKTLVKIFYKKDFNSIKSGDFVTLAKVLGIGFISVGPAAILVSLGTYLQAESTIRINFTMCLYN
ncbi:C47 family peptidase [Pseudolactococcus piscium]|uniref:C47 family peptidase n=1 Tax=Pseudolactococcus piscium TaxID=1364 RepID=UPI000BDF3B2B|nr:C47 family peptidase [Lactococcus piscium]